MSKTVNTCVINRDGSIRHMDAKVPLVRGEQRIRDFAEESSIACNLGGFSFMSASEPTKEALEKAVSLLQDWLKDFG